MVGQNYYKSDRFIIIIIIIIMIFIIIFVSDSFEK